MANSASALGVSRETYEKLNAFADLVCKWNPRINLIAKSTVQDIWHRHISDSLQVVGLSKNPSTWLDIGSGGGFPGMVVAIALHEISPDSRVTLVESDNRKCVFLRTASRELAVPVSVVASRIEHLAPHAATTLSARALAGLSSLIEYSDMHLHKDGVALFQKGENWREEVNHAREKWSFDLDVINSRTDESAAILKVAKIKRKS